MSTDEVHMSFKRFEALFCKEYSHKVRKFGSDTDLMDLTDAKQSKIYSWPFLEQSIFGKVIFCNGNCSQFKGERNANCVTDAKPFK